MAVGLLRKVLTWVLTAACAVGIAYSLFGLGFLACTTSQATAAIGGTFSGWEHSTFSKENMAQIAEEVRSFSIDGASTDALFSAIQDAARESNVAESLKSSERYTLPENALSHLSDCTPIFTTGRISVGVVGGFSLAGLVALLILAGRKRVGRTIIAGASLVGALLLLLGLWAIVDFNGLFTWMHTMLFAQGNWTFSSTSLLIQLFPEAFWAAMAALWVVASLICAAIAGIAGRIIAL